MLGGAVLGGFSIGAVTGGRFMKIGRRKSLTMSMFVGIAACGITQYLSIWTIIIGRFWFGFSVGLTATICTRYTEETIPPRLMSSFGAFYSVISGFGVLVGYLLGELLPDDDDKAALKKTERWRIMYAYFPIAYMLLIIFGLVFVVKHDSIKFLITKGKVKEARKAIKKVYKHAKSKR